jgi:hypothetical protein
MWRGAGRRTFRHLGQRVHLIGGDAAVRSDPHHLVVFLPLTRCRATGGKLELRRIFVADAELLRPALELVNLGKSTART